MSTAFGDVRFVLAQLKQFEVGKSLAQHVLRVHMRGEGRTAGFVLDLLGRVALQLQNAAGLEAAGDAGKQALTHRRVGELNEDRGHAVVDRLGPGVGIAVAD